MCSLQSGSSNTCDQTATTPTLRSASVGRVPFGVDESKYHSFGLTGKFLSERVAGALTVPEASDGYCTFRWLPQAAIDGIRIGLRRSEDDWRAHSRRYSILALGGLMSLVMGIVAGLVMLVVGRISRRRLSSSGTH